MNQLGKKNYIEDIRDHILFELKENMIGNNKNYYLNIKITDSICPTEYLSIWTTDDKITDIYKMIMAHIK